MTRRNSGIPHILLALGVILALVSGFEMYRDPMPAGIFASSDAADLGQRCFEPLRPALKDVRVAGYVSSRPPTTANDMGAYFLAQYFLAPSVLLPRTRESVLVTKDAVLVTNLDTQAQMESLARDAGYEVVRQSHPGLRLQVQPGLAVLRKKVQP